MLPFKVATKPPEPTRLAAVTVAVYVPLLLSVAEPTVPVPVELENTTVDPPAPTLLLY